MLNSPAITKSEPNFQHSTRKNENEKDKPSGKTVSLRVFDMDNVEASWMSFARGDDADSAQVVAAGHHAQVARFKLDEVQDLAAGDVETDGVVDFDQRVGVSDRSAIVGDDERDALRSCLHLLHSTQFVLKAEIWES